jgi:hypothetical protein
MYLLGLKEHVFYQKVTIYSRNNLCAIFELLEPLSSRMLERQDTAELSAMQQPVSLLSDMVPSSLIWKLY